MHIGNIIYTHRIIIHDRIYIYLFIDLVKVPTEEKTHARIQYR